MFKYVFQYLRQHQKKILVYIITCYFSLILTLCLPILSGKIIDVIIQKGVNNKLENLVFWFAIIQMISLIIQYISYKINIDIQSEIAFLMNSTIIQHIQKVSIIKMGKYDSTYLNQRINNDCNTIVTFVISFLTDCPLNIFMLLGSAIILFNIDKSLLAILCIASFTYILTYFVVKKKIFNLSFLLKERQSLFFSNLMEQLENVHFIQIHSLYKKFADNLKVQFRSYKKQYINSQKFFYLYSSLENVITTVVQIIVFLWGGNMVLKNHISIGSMTIVINYFQYIMSSVKYFSDLGKSYQDNKVSYNRILELLNIEENVRGSYELDDIFNIDCHNLTFKRNGRIIINDFNYSFSKGNVYVIVGENGSGKTTIIDLILGLYEGDYEGEILYNGVNIETINMEKVRYELIATMEQFPFVFSGNLEQNIYLTERHTLENIDCYKENMPSYIKFSMRSESNDANEINYSGGEKQKIAFLRVMAKNADVLILDEPTASLDSKTKDEFVNYIQSQKKSKIIIIVSHDPEIMQVFNKHIYIDYLNKNII